EQLREQASALAEAGLSRLSSVTDDFNAALPTLQQAGYWVKDVAVHFGIAPRVIASFTCESAASEAEIRAMMDEHRDRKLTVALLGSLYEASKLQSRIHLAGLKPSGISIEVGLTPQVSVKFG